MRKGAGGLRKVSRGGTAIYLRARIIEEFEEQQEVTADYASSQSNATDSSSDGVTDKEAHTPARTRPMSPPRVSKPLSIAGRFVPEKQYVTVTSTRTRKQERKAYVVGRTTWEPANLGDREAIVAPLEQGRAKRWEPRLTGGKPLRLKLHKLGADSDDIKMGNTKIFVKNPHTLFDLEDQKTKALVPMTATIQSKARGYICRRRCLRFLAVIDRVGLWHGDSWRELVITGYWKGERGDREIKKD